MVDFLCYFSSVKRNFGGVSFRYQLSFYYFNQYFKRVGCFVNKFTLYQTPVCFYIQVEYYRSSFVNSLFYKASFFKLFKKFVEYSCFNGVPVKLFFIDLGCLLEESSLNTDVFYTRNFSNVFLGSVDLLKLSVLSLCVASSALCANLISFCIIKNARYSLVYDFVDFVFREAFENFVSKCEGFLFLFKGRLDGQDRTCSEIVSVGQVVPDSSKEKQTQYRASSSFMLASGVNNVVVLFCFRESLF